jgi:hypothetical protein
MGAERKTMLEVKVVTDHDCGNYRIGEIDTVPDQQVAEYIARFGEYGYQELLNFTAAVAEAARKSIRAHRLAKDPAAAVQAGG